MEGAPYSLQWQDDAGCVTPSGAGQVDRMYQPAGPRHRPAGGPASAAPDAERDTIGQRWADRLYHQPLAPCRITPPTDAVFAMWQNSQLEIDRYDPLPALTKSCSRPPAAREEAMYSGQRDGVPYFIHYTATEDQSYTMAVG